MSDSTKKYPYEENAEPCTIQGWKCRGCGKIFPFQHLAQKCCAGDYPCVITGCSNRLPSFAICPPCRSRRTRERYLKLVEVDWDGETPLVGFDDDRFFWSEEDLVEYLNDIDDGELLLEDLMLVQCEIANPVFSMDKFLEAAEFTNDDKPYPDATEVEAVVNDYLQNKLHKMWMPGKKRIRVTSLGIVKGPDGWDYGETTSE